MKDLIRLLKEKKDSELPEDRLFYRSSMYELIDDMKKVLAIKPNEETAELVKTLEEDLTNYKIYPKL